MKGRKKDPGSVTQMTPAGGRCPAAPKWLTGVARLEWKNVAPFLFERGHLTPGVVPTLAAYCIACELVQSSNDTLALEGRTFHSPTGVKLHPEHRVLTQALRDVRLLAAELGLLPFRQSVRGDDGESAGDWTSDDKRELLG